MIKGELTIMCGLPGSGKSTTVKKLLEKPGLSAIVSKDCLRSMLFGEYVFETIKEYVVHDVAESIMCKLLAGGAENIIIDETNTTVKRRAELIKLAKHFDYKPVIVWCQHDSNNIARRMKEPRGYSKEKWEQVIAEMEERFEAPTDAECPVVVIPPPPFKG